MELHDRNMSRVHVSGVDPRRGLFEGIRMRSVELRDISISGEFRDVVINGVDIGPLVEAELNRRMPERILMRPDTVEGFRLAWATLERLWASTIERAAARPPATLAVGVDDEWSFIETLRHLNFASAAWVERMILGNLSPWHSLDLPWDGAPGWDGIPWDRTVQPQLAEVLVVRRERQASVSGVMSALTEEQLVSTVSRSAPGWPCETDFPVKECLLIVLNEEWEHRLFAERDLEILSSAG